MRTSEHLNDGDVYSRAALSRMFHIRDATIRTGIFKPKGHDSIWLFVTELKTRDRTQYVDALNGDDLHWDGGMSGRKDNLIVNHRSQNLELVVFYCRRKNEFGNCGFRYEDVFEYVSHEARQPTKVHLRRRAAHSMPAG